MESDVYVRTKEAKRVFGVSTPTLVRWADEGRVDYKRTIGNHRVYNISKPLLRNKSIVSNGGSPAVYSPNEKKDDRIKYLYCRVSSRNQLDDLERQIGFLSSLPSYSSHRIIKDVGSGLNFKRKGLLKLLDQCINGRVEEIVVASKDRLCRFDLIAFIFEKYNVKLVVLDNCDKSPEQELEEDVLSILQVFVCRWNGKRRYKIKSSGRERQNDDEQQQFQNKKTEIEIEIGPEETSTCVE